jgi:hypothetical protein
LDAHLKAMLDPLTSLGLAASIAQLLDFGFKFVSETKEISEYGSSVDVAHLKSLTTDLVDIQSSLKERGRNAAGTGTLSREEQVSSPAPRQGCDADSFLNVGP